MFISMVNRTLPKEAPEFHTPRRVAGALGGREEGSEHISAGRLRVPLSVLGFLRGLGLGALGFKDFEGFRV